MNRTGTVCPKCGSTSRPIKEKIMGQDTLDLICRDCRYMGFWTEFQPEEQEGEDSKQ